MSMLCDAARLRSAIIRTKKVLSGTRSGAFKKHYNGAGYEFDQLREYQQGDDIRFIDWKSTARTNKLLIREYKDERSRTMNVLIDVSSSLWWGTQRDRNCDILLQIAAAFVAIGEIADDSIGMYFAHEKLEKVIMPRSGGKHRASLIAELMRYKNDSSRNKKTALGDALHEFGKRMRKKSLLFVISDFIDEGYGRILKILAQKHEVAVVRIRDKHEESVLGFTQSIEFEDSETGAIYSSGLTESSHQLIKSLRMWRSKQDMLFNRLHIPCCDCFAGSDYIGQLVAFLHRYF